MNFTVDTVARALADYLAPVLPGATMYEDPNQQGSRPPMLFLQQRYSSLRRETGGFWLRRLGLELTYLLAYNLPDMQRRYQRAAEALDLVMETFPYSDGAAAQPVRIRTYEREWQVDLDALHYRFELRERVTLPESFHPLRTMDYHEEVIDGRENA